VSPLSRTGETCGLEWGWTVPREQGGVAEGDRGNGVRATVIEVHALPVKSEYQGKLINVELKRITLGRST
jgi:hypothetical protein